jgi:hypothetical protein
VSRITSGCPIWQQLVVGAILTLEDRRKILDAGRRISLSAESEIETRAWLYSYPVLDLVSHETHPGFRWYLEVPMLGMGLLILLIIALAGVLVASVNYSKQSRFHDVPRRRRRL